MDDTQKTTPQRRYEFCLVSVTEGAQQVYLTLPPTPTGHVCHL